MTEKNIMNGLTTAIFLSVKHDFTNMSLMRQLLLFNYCITEANDPAIKTEAAIWLARIYNETGNYSESLRILNELDITD